ncbi:MAG: DUF3971 domain-containing protein [Roseomonas sp.]|nr:DUF3971 domain-containing protein [Roseomonas sp.]
MARQAHLAAQALLGLLLAVLLLLAALGWRLSQGPVETPFLARAIEAEVAAHGDGRRLEVGRASIAWDGFRSAGLTPLQLRLSGLRLLAADGTLRAVLPEAAVSLSLPWLLRGELAPRRLELEAPQLRLRRDAAGDISIELGTGGTTADAPAGIARLEDLLAEMMRPPTEDTPLGAVALLGIRGAHVAVEDSQLGTSWSLDQADIELRRLPAGGVTARFTAVLRLGEARTPIAGSGEAQGAPATLALRLSLPELHPASLAPHAPALGMLDAPLRLDLSVGLGADGVLHRAAATLTAGPGALDLGAGRRVKMAGAEAAAEWRPEGLRLTRAALRLDGPGTPLLTATGAAARAGEGWRAEGTVALDALPIAELSRWWPKGIGDGARDWILANLTAGVARNGQWRIALEGGPGLHAPRIAALAGTLDVADATIHWLRPAPQLEGAEGVVRFGLDEIAVQLAAARVAGTRIQAREGIARFLDPFGNDPRTEIEFDLAGTVPEVLGVLQHPRLRLFESRPLPLRGPQGTLGGRVTLGFPLLNDLKVQQMRIGARAQLRQLRLAEVVLGHGIDRGAFDLQIDNNGLRASGTARLADIQARIAVETDFRAGPPGQVVTQERVTARADSIQLAALGLGSEEVLRGPVALDIRSERRRNGQGRVTLRADLRDAELALEPLAWSKPAGQNAGAEAVLRLNGETLEAVESFRVDAPSLLLRGNAAFGRGMRLERVTVNEGRIEDSRFGGEARLPARPGEPWIVMLRGQVLDLRRAMADQSPSAPPASDTPGPAVSIDGRFERVLLAPGRELEALEARVLLDGRGVLREGRINGRTGPQAPFTLTVTPQERGRALAVTAEDAGALLRAFGILRSVQGGRLRVAASYPHDGRGAPLTGQAEIDDFAVTDAPSFTKLLQALTVYGLLDALSGPEVGFARLIAPFTLTPDTLVLAEARAFSASLGLTAKGSIDRRRQHLQMEGTIVPAYLLNTLLGNLPIIGRLFSPETSGGLFAATWKLQGPLDDPQVSVNPLAALTPGFLRGLFDFGQPPPAPPPR